jgi:hypothetical protein
MLSFKWYDFLSQWKIFDIMYEMDDFLSSRIRSATLRRTEQEGLRSQQSYP